MAPSGAMQVGALVRNRCTTLSVHLVRHILSGLLGGTLQCYRSAIRADLLLSKGETALVIRSSNPKVTPRGHRRVFRPFIHLSPDQSHSANNYKLKLTVIRSVTLTVNNAIGYSADRLNNTHFSFD